MASSVNRERLVRCLSIPCSWQNDGEVESCPWRSAGPRATDRFRHNVCRLYSTPGPHSISMVARTVGVPISKVKELESLAKRKMLRSMLSDHSLMHTPLFQNLNERMETPA